MHILGINAYHADSSAAIFSDGKLIAATEEERFRRVKHWAGFPSMAIEFCLEEAGITLEQVDHIAIGRDPYAKLLKKIWFLLTNPSASWRVVADRFSNAKKVSSIEHEFAMIDDALTVSDLKKKVHQVEHHRSHLASAFFASPFSEAALLSIDGSGDFTTTMTGIGKENHIDVIASIDFPHSVGIFYTAFTQWLGFPHYGDEYKLMGLAPYGNPVYVDKLREVLRFGDDGKFSLNLRYFRSATQGIISYGDDHIPQVAPLFSDLLVERFGPARKKEDQLTNFHKDMAASVQRITEELIFSLASHLYKQTGMTNLCIAGGVAQNSVANGKITRKTPFRKIYIPSAGHDAGIAMGAALYVYNQILHQPKAAPIFTPYTGSRFSNEEIETILHSTGTDSEKLEDRLLFAAISECLVDGGVVGWFSGRAEFGPRALGARSILADPRRADAKEILNAKIKRRESFRPFAPSILREYVSEFFDLSEEVPFMERVFPIRAEKRDLIPAVTHVDGSGRLQTVDRTISPRYYGVIDSFREKTGIPILLNTSFNENEPIVNSPAEALDCFMRTNMDMLVLENHLIRRQL
ncbi:MAG TPA: carbamoyltransferase [Puia sp.]|nr:carbamoyltransferase [Puia sp.]